MGGLKLKHQRFTKTHENPKEQERCQTPKSEYEKSREERIRQNLEKMKKLGIVELSLGLKRNNTLRQPRRLPNNYNNKTPPSVSPLQRSSEPSRRSSRLKNATPVMYSEVDLSKKNKAVLFDSEDFAGESKKPEIYTEEHYKLLGSTEKSWTLFVDGYGSDGKRIYDPVNGKTCHQCRQKTLGQRTHCIECNKVQGQFCGDCLYIRYGEHVLEANENPDWICPVCRGICNCSLCRIAKGWAPTGPLYKKITRLGFKSVAHYLIQNHCSEAKVANNNMANEVSVKRSLAFSDVDVQCGQLEDKSDDKDSSNLSLPVLTLTPGIESIGSFAEEEDSSKRRSSRVLNKISPDGISERLKSRHRKAIDRDNEIERQKEPVSSDTDHLGSVDSLPNMTPKLAIVPVPRSDGIDGRSSDGVEAEKWKEEFLSDGDLNITIIPLKTTPKLKQKLALVSVPSSDSIGGRLRQRRMDLKVVSSENEAIGTPSKGTPKLNQKRALVVVPSSDSIGGRLRQRRMDLKVVSSGNEAIGTPLKGTPKLNQKRALVVVPSSDSIGGRLRQRRKISSCV